MFYASVYMAEGDILILNIYVKVFYVSVYINMPAGHTKCQQRVGPHAKPIQNPILPESARPLGLEGFV